MDKKSVIAAIGASLVIIGALAYFLTTSQTAPHNHTDHDHAATSQEESETYKRYSKLKGDEYDKTFISEMISHHNGAIKMAELAATRAKHQELKETAANIVTSQSKEVAQLTTWQKQWGYPASPAEESHSHEMIGGIMSGMDMSVGSLERLSGDEFDKMFIMAMTDHHQQAVDMARPAAKNAKHQELKSAAEAIISAQSAEIDQMKQWKKDWRY